MLRETQVELSKGLTIAMVVKKLGEESATTLQRKHTYRYGLRIGHPDPTAHHTVCLQ